MEQVGSMVRALNFNDETIEVTVGDRTLLLRQLPRVPLQRILDAILEGNQEEEPVSEGKSTAELFLSQWEKALPVLVSMFGENPETDAGKELATFLNDHLPPMAAVRIFDEWWRLNEIDDFFMRGGRTLLLPQLVTSLKALQKERESEILTQVQEAVAEPEPVVKGKKR